MLDIEGTTSSISFVYDVMFPFARRELARYLAESWGSVDLRRACDMMAQDQGFDWLDDWCPGATDEQRQATVREEALRLMDEDAKTTGLKQLQGLIWRAGFETGELRAQVYDDVPAALRAWNTAGYDVRIYSSGSIAAQKLFFRHTLAGDLLPLLRGHYDTTTGSKKEAESYRAIAADFGLPGAEILFLSDVIEELEAAREAGFATALCLRPGNAVVEDRKGHAAIESFAQIDVR